MRQTVIARAQIANVLAEIPPMQRLAGLEQGSGLADPCRVGAIFLAGRARRPRKRGFGNAGSVHARRRGGVGAAQPRFLPEQVAVRLATGMGAAVAARTFKVDRVANAASAGLIDCVARLVRDL